jgi:hypothetical protein
VSEPNEQQLPDGSLIRKLVDETDVQFSARLARARADAHETLYKKVAPAESHITRFLRAFGRHGRS